MGNLTLLEKVNQNPPDWSENTIEPYPYGSEADIQEYAASFYWNSNESVNVHDIVGTAHPNYAGKSWLWLLNNGKRMHNINLPLAESNPGYYYETIVKYPEMSYRRVDGNTYIHMEGNHRTCIAKFLFYYNSQIMLHGVHFSEFILSHELKKAHAELDNALRQNNVSGCTRVLRSTIKRDDTAGWMREYYDLKIGLEARGGKMILTLPEVYDMIADSRRSFRKVYGKYKHIWRG